jgi:hypothetical protein
MGNPAMAILVYGFIVLNDEGDEPAEGMSPSWLLSKVEGKEGERIGIEDIVAQLENIQPPSEEYTQDDQQVMKKYEDFWQRRRDAEKQSGIELIDHCRSENQMWILGIAESHKSPWRGDFERLGQKIEAKPEWRDTLKNFCDKAGIPFTEPEWLLAPYTS